MLNLSFKYLLLNKNQTFLTLVGIILGSFLYVAINGFFRGSQSYLMENLVNNAHIKITPRDSTPSARELQKRIYENKTLLFFINNPKQKRAGQYIKSPELWYRRFNWDKDVVTFSPQITSNAMITKIPPPKMVNGSTNNLSKKKSFVKDERGRINSIEVRLKDFKSASDKVSHWNSVSDEQIESWDQINKIFLNVFKMQNATRYLMILITLILTSFGIFNFLNMVVNNKKKDIAIFGALGITPKQISKIFLSQGILLGVTGGILGLILGYFVCLFIETIPMGTETGRLNVSFEISIYIQGFLIALFSSIISSYYSSRVAFKLQPAPRTRNCAGDGFHRRFHDDGLPCRDVDLSRHGHISVIVN